MLFIDVKDSKVLQSVRKMLHFIDGKSNNRTTRAK